MFSQRFLYLFRDAIAATSISALIGPSHSIKSTHIPCTHRLNNRLFSVSTSQIFILWEHNNLVVAKPVIHCCISNQSSICISPIFHCWTQIMTVLWFFSLNFTDLSVFPAKMEIGDFLLFRGSRIYGLWFFF